ncbi:hypothetical protein [Sporosarcina sp. 6E9]|uniref:hypothetical protein n=1 Tax=Sporosarcina sp. 6E9 TaxID=2819235 RepID=UPI001B3175E0|nr:hypothetical protein [Sporosarcina sp. 6E9]
MVSKNYPHPVLNKFTDDFDHANAKFEIQIVQRIEGSNYNFDCEVDLFEEELEQLLREDKIKFVVKVACSSTRYRSVFEFDKAQKSITLPSSQIENSITFETFIVARTYISSYSSKSFDDDYEDASFSIFPGDILAEGSVYDVNITKLIDPLVKLPSIFNIVFNENKEAQPIDVRYPDHKIIISLNKKNFNQYRRLKQLHGQYGQLAALTSSIFITPALVVVLEALFKQLSAFQHDFEAIKEYIAEQEDEHRWFKVINAKLIDQGIDLHDPRNISDSALILAQKLLGDPLSNGLEFFEEFFNAQGEEENN